MSKLEKLYEHLKRKDDKKLYLFKVGNFYIFLGSDANYINNYSNPQRKNEEFELKLFHLYLF